jgi:Family of unknown function (DUF5995)
VTDDQEMRTLAELTGTEPARDIPEVLRRLDAMQAYANATFTRRDEDGIACFTRLYRVITAAIAEWEQSGKFEAPNGFLTRLDVEFAERYFEAVRTYATNRDATPGCWKVLFDHRGAEHIPEASFAAAGVNAHINYDLSAALLLTWAHNDPDEDGHRDLQHRDYNAINRVFEEHMDKLREDLHTFLSRGPDGSIGDILANMFGDLVVRLTRALAWEEADHLWRSGERHDAVALSDEHLSEWATAAGAVLLRIPMP